MPLPGIKKEHQISIWSAIPKVNFPEGFTTKFPSDSPHVLTASQVVDWTSFPAEVHSIRRGRDRVHGGFIGFISEVLGKIFHEAKIYAKFADFSAGKPTEGSRLDSRLKPDIVILGTARREIRAVGELKTEWAFEPREGETNRAFLIRKFGQVARYMDDLKCTYGFLTTYKETFFLKRRDKDTFLATFKPIRASKVAMASNSSDMASLSLLECMAFLLFQSLSPEARFETVKGLKLTNVVGRDRRRRGSRQAPANKKQK